MSTLHRIVTILVHYINDLHRINSTYVNT